MLLRGRNLLAYHRFETAGRARVRRRGGRDRDRRHPHLRRAQRHRRDAGAIEAALETPALVEGALCYTGDLSTRASGSTRSTTTCAWPSSSSTPGVHVLAIKDMAGLLRAPAAQHAGRGAARALRRAGAPAHPRHRRRVARDLPRRGRGGRRRDRRRRRAARRDDEPAVARRRSSRRSPATRARHRPVARRGAGARALLGGRARALRAVRGRARRRRPAASTATRSPAASSRTSASRPRRSASAAASRRSSVAYERANALLGDIVKVTPTSKVVGDLALYAVSAGIDLDELERAPERFDLPDCVLDFLRGGLGAAAGRLPAAVHRPRARGPHPAKPPRTARATRTARRSRARARAPGRARPDHVPRPYARLPRGPRGATATSRCSPTAAFFYGLREDEALPVDLAPGVRVIFELEAIGEPDENGVPHRDGARQRSAAADRRPRPHDHRRRTADRTRRPRQPRSRRRAGHRRRRDHHVEPGQQRRRRRRRSP